MTLRRSPGRRRRHAEPEWTEPSTGRRIVVESGDGAIRWAAERRLSECGYCVVGCDGPVAGHPCALIASGRCPIIERADIVVNVLEQSHGSPACEVFAAMRETYPGLPIVVEARACRGGEIAVDDATVAMSPPLRTATLLDALATVERHLITTKARTRRPAEQPPPDASARTTRHEG